MKVAAGGGPGSRRPPVGDPDQRRALGEVVSRWIEVIEVLIGRDWESSCAAASTLT